ncbi:MAG: RDD family protein [Acidimicrobiales bacterium]
MAALYPPPPPPGYRDPTDVVGRRIGAFFIDLAVVLAMLVALGVAAGAALAESMTLREALRHRDCRLEQPDFGDSDALTLDCENYLAFESDDGTVTLIPLWPFVVIVPSVSFLYYGVVQGLASATVGKLALGLRVVRESDGQPHGIGRSLVRWLFFLIDGPFTIYLCGLVTSLASRGHRRVGDMVAGTYVVDHQAAGRPVLLLGAPGFPGYGPPTGWPAPTPGWPAPTPGSASPPAPGWPAPTGWAPPPPYEPPP